MASGTIRTAVMALALLAGAVKAQSIRVQTTPTSSTVHVDDRLLMEYRLGEVPFKPYVRQLLSPGGINILRDAPADHLHHHGLMFAIAADGVDFWAETDNCGRQIHRSAQSDASGENDSQRATLTEQLDWVGADGAAILQEQRTLTLHTARNLPATLLTWRTVLRPADGKDQVKLTGSHYFGLGMRFLQSMDKDGEWIFPQKRSEPTTVRGDEKLTRAAWCAYTAAADGKPVTVALFDHPKNLRHPCHFFTMTIPFSYMSATTNLWKDPVMLPKSASLNLCYGVAVFDGKATVAQIDKVYLRWMGMNGVSFEP